MTTSASEEQRIPSLWNAFEYTDRQASYAAINYLLTDNKDYKPRYFACEQAGTIILRAYNAMHGMATKHELPK